MGNLLQFLLALATQQHDDTDAARTAAAAAAAGVRALTTAALHLGWDKLYLGYPLLLQVSARWAGSCLGHRLYSPVWVHRCV